MRPVPVVFLLLALMDQLSETMINETINHTASHTKHGGRRLLLMVKSFNHTVRLVKQYSIRKEHPTFQRRTLLLKQKQTYMSAIWPLDIHTVNMSIFGYDTRIYRIDGTTCASYYAAFQNWMYPSSEILIRKIF